jgi:predicted dithiol-disulfide oxidoreductase (DUF899 family)
MEPLHTIRFPNESADYRAARDRLLEAEVQLRRQLETVAAARRNLPLGGVVKEDYVFDEQVPDPRRNDAHVVHHTRLSELFQDGKDTLVIYSFMYGPEMKEACPSCTSILDGLDGEAPHIRQRVNFVVVAKSPIDRIQEFAAGRGWRNLRLLSSARNSYNADYQGQNAKGNQTPVLNVFVKRGEAVHHSYSTELLFVKPEPGQDGRHVDLIWPLWNVLDYTPEGRGTDFNPKLRYTDAEPRATLARAKSEAVRSS